MIKDQNVVTDIRDDWKSVRLKQNRIKINTLSAIGKISTQFADLCYTLILIYAYSVLHDTLIQLHEEKFFTVTKKDRLLGTLMYASQNVLPWVHFALVDKGREQRNNVAHEDLVLPRGEIWEYIDAIERELVSWQIIPDPDTDYSVPYGKRSTP
ncbi:MAG: hypothetical protein ACE5JL_11375 [Dehalococcoidia bacterium]